MTRLALAAAALLLCGCRFFNDPKEPSEAVLHGAPKAPAQVSKFTAMSAEQWLDRSVATYKDGRYLEAIGEAQTALFLKPGLAEAWNNIGVCYAELHLWDLAIQAESEAVRLQPNFELAKNNIAWALSQKQQGVK
jgi:tetratricopeptide (TPR) repeat protein